MAELKTLTLNGIAYDSFVDKTARANGGTGGATAEQIAQIEANKENIKKLSAEVDGFTDYLFESSSEGEIPYEYTEGCYTDNNGVALYNGMAEATSVWSCVVLDVSKNIGENFEIVTCCDRIRKILFVDENLNIIDSVYPDTANPNKKFQTTVTVPENATTLIINHYHANTGGVDVSISGRTVVERYVSREAVETIFNARITQEQGDSETKVMSQKAVTELVGKRDITPILPSKNRVPIVDEDVAVYLDNMFQGISPKSAVNVSTQNAYVLIFEKEVALLTKDNITTDGSAAIRLHFGDNTKYEVFKSLPYAKASAKTGTKKVLFIGDSITENKSYLTPLKQLSDNGDYKIDPLGTLGDDGLKNEGRGGWAAYNYCNNDSFGNKTNAFWDGSAFNFNYYMQNSGIEVPDYIFINLGTNDPLRGITNTSDDEEVKIVILTSYEAMINSIRAYSTTIPIVLWLPPTRSLIGRNNHIAIDKSLKVNKMLIDKFDTSAYFNNRVYLMPTYLFVNPYTDYPSFTHTIGGVEYKDGTEAIHPNSDGGEKIAKGIVRQMMYIDGLIGG